MLRNIAPMSICRCANVLPGRRRGGVRAGFIRVVRMRGGVGSERSAAALEPTPAGYPQGTITLLAPANPGGGCDQTARQLQQVWTAEGILGVPVEVVNRGGAGGTIGLADMVTRYRDDARTLMVFGQVPLGAIRTNRSPVLIEDTIPLARLLSEYEVVAVPADSRFRTLPELMEEFRRDPESVSWAGGSAGGIDQILVGLLAQAAGVDPRRANYITHSRDRTRCCDCELARQCGPARHRCCYS